MPRIWVLVLLGLEAISLGVDACAPGFEPFFDGKCLRLLMAEKKSSYADMKMKCEKLNALPVIIRNKKENDDILVAVKNFAEKNGMSPFSMWIGLKCNAATKQFVWEDGTIANYTNFQANYSCSASTQGKFFSRHPTTGRWWQDEEECYQILCQHPLMTKPHCATDMDLVSGSSGDACLSLRHDALSWTDAEKKCSSVSAHLVSIHDDNINNFIRRSVIAQNFTNAIHIGAFRNDSTWKDGTKMDYLHYYPGFPNFEENGDCVAMQTRSPFNGKWINVDCNVKLSYACGRPALNYSSPLPSTCQNKQEYRSGDSLYSPGYPGNGSAQYCDDYILRAPKGKRIELTVVVFESNLCCDSLTLYDGLMEMKQMAVLNGYYAAGTKFTSKTNFIRMTWSATSAANVSGFHLTMRQV